MKSIFRFPTGILFAGIFIFSACSGEASDKGSTRQAPAGGANALRISGYIAKADSTSGTYSASGELVARNQVDLKTETTGRLVKLYAKDGQKVSKGTLIAKLDDSELQANLKSAEAALDLAKKKLERTKTLHEKDGATTESLESAESSVQTATAARDLILAQLQKTELRAPFDGKLGIVSVSEGAWMSSGSDVATLTDSRELNVEFELPQRYAASLKIGDRISLSDSEQKTNAQATVKFLDAEISKTSRTRKVRATLPNKDGRYLAGTFVGVNLNFGSGSEVGMPVPSEALTLDANGSYVFIVKDGKAKQVYVKTGLRTPITVDITSGLNSGDTVIVSGLMRMRDGLDVIVKEINNTMNYGVVE